MSPVSAKMDKRELKKIENYKKFHIQGMPNYARPKINVIYFSIANTKAHELKKLEVAYDLRKQGYDIITEAVENETGLRRDVVCLHTGEIYEIETDPRRAKRFEGTKVNVIKLFKEKK